MAKTISRRHVGTTGDGAKISSPAGTKTTTIFVESPTVPMYYANNTAVETTVWDVCLKFAETVETDRELNITKVRELARVRVSPQHARVIVGILNQHLQKYEQEFGAIPAVRQQPAEKSDK